MIAISPQRRTVVLMDPPYYRLFKDTYSLPRYPLSLAYLAGQARKHTDWNVVAYNADFSPTTEPIQVSHLSGAGFQEYRRNLRNDDADIWREIDRTVSAYQPAVVGISCKSQTFASARIVARLIKLANPDTLVVVGGPHVAMVGSEVLACDDIDMAVAGEGERTLVELLHAVAAGIDLAGVDGIFYRCDGKIAATAPRALMSDLDDLGYPHAAAAEVLHDYELYPREAFSHIFAVRGCPYNCFFCGSRNVWSRKVRFRSPENVIEEVAQLISAGVGTIHFDDDTFGVRRDYIEQLCDGIERRCPGTEWTCELHVNLVNDPVVARMARAGCKSIQLGIESGNNEILRHIRKGFVIGKALAAAKTIRRHGVGVQAFFMVGFPQETPETLADTVKAMRQIEGMLSYSIFTPYPGTEAFEYCREHGLIGDDYDIAMHNHQSPANCFCEHISHDEFRRLVSRIERMVDRHNWPGPIRRVAGAGLRAIRRLVGA